jgi:hypothetical protein
MTASDAAPDSADVGHRSGADGRTLIALYVAFAAFALLVYRGALSGPFLSDDGTYVVANPYLRMPLAELATAAFAPDGDARHYMAGNYAPLMHLAHAIEVRLFGSEIRGYHVVNVLMHALNSVLLFALLLRSGLARSVAIAGAALFLVHPANVETVAWVSQLRSLVSMAGALAALLVFQRAPVASAACFAVGLLSKATTSFVVPMAAVFLYAEHRTGRTIRSGVIALVLWIAIFAMYAPIQMDVFSSMARGFGDPYPDVWIHLRSIAAIGARYLAMAATGYGVSAYHEPTPVHSSLDPWWLAGAVAALCFSARIAWTLRRADPEAGWWIGAAAAFAPISQVLPFTFGMGDRYLYFILPGLIGGSCLAGAARVQRASTTLRRGALAAAALWIGAFALHASQRANLWQGEGYLLEDAASNYPDGVIGHYVAAILALERRDPDTALSELHASAERGASLIHPFHNDAWLMPLDGDPRFQALLERMAQMQIDSAKAQGVTTPSQLFIVGSAHYLRNELDLAKATLEQAARLGGPMQSQTLVLLERVEKERAGLEPHAAFRPRPSTGYKPIFEFPSGRRLFFDEWPEP